MILYNGYALITPSGLDENDKPYCVYRIYKAKPLTSLSSDETFDNEADALAAAKAYVDEHLPTVHAATATPQGELVHAAPGQREVAAL